MTPKSVVVECRAYLASAAKRISGAVIAHRDAVQIGGVEVARRMGENVVVSAVWEPAGRSSRRMVTGSETLYPTDGVERLVAAITSRHATRLRIAEVARAA